MLGGFRHRRSWFAQAFAAFALLAFAVRALVPAGYMFAPAQDGRFLTVTLCSGHGAVETLLDLSTGQLVDPDDVPDNTPENPPSADAPCVFATVAALAAPEQPATLPFVFHIAAVELSHAFGSVPGQGLAAPPPWSTGPPLTL